MENKLGKRKMRARIVQSVREFGWTEVRLTLLLAPSSKNDPEFPVGTCITPHINATQSSTDTWCSYTNSTSDLSEGAGRTPAVGNIYVNMIRWILPGSWAQAVWPQTPVSLVLAQGCSPTRVAGTHTHTEVCAGRPGHSWTPRSQPGMASPLETSRHQWNSPLQRAPHC